MSGRPPSESLGWLTESAVQPRQARAIQIDQSSVVNLKATLFQTEEQLKTSGDGSSRRRARKPTSGGDPWTKANKGLRERDLKAAEQEQLEHVQRQEKMRKKVEMYQKLASGLAPASGDASALVDFERKGWEKLDKGVVETPDDAKQESNETDARGPRSMVSRALDAEEQRLEWEEEAKTQVEMGGQTPIDRPSSAVLQAYHKTLTRVEKKMLEDIEQETEAARKRFSDVQHKRKVGMEERRKQLQMRKKRRAELQKQLESSSDIQ